MKVAIIYLHVKAKGYPSAPPPDYYRPFSLRFADTYQKFEAGIDHDLVVVSCGGDPDESVWEIFSPIATCYQTYLGAGSDLGACQNAMRQSDADFVVCMATPVYFWKPGWLKRLVEARTEFGDGLYGPFASNECTPHIRTSCWAVDPATFNCYPHLIDNREKCYWAEHRDQSEELWHFTRWYEALKKPTLMVSWTGALGPKYWRTEPNIFCRGDQSNVLIRDRYTDLYETYSAQEKVEVEKRVNGA